MSEIDWRGFLNRNQPHPSAPVPMWAWLIIEMLGVLMAAQDQVNADVEAIAAALQSVAASQTTIANDLATIAADLKAQGVDTTALDAVAVNAADGAKALADTVAQLDATVNPPAPAV